MNQAAQNPDYVLPGPAGAGAPPPVMPPLTKRRRTMARFAWIFAFLVLIVSVVSLVLAWQTQDRVRNLEFELVKRQVDSSDQANEARMLSKAAEDSARASAAKVALLEARVAEVSMQRGQLEDVIQQLSRSRDENLVVDIDAAIRVAQQQMLITGSAESMVATLRQADERLARSNQPRLEGVRRAIARDLDRARAVGGVNIASLSIKLDEAVRLVDELPLIASADTRRDAASSVAPASAGRVVGQRSAAIGSAASAGGATAAGWTSEWLDGWNVFWGHVWAEARGLVRVTRIDNPEAMLIAPDNAFFLRENLKLRLLNARLAVLSRQFDTAQSDLLSVQTTLERYFDRNSRKVTVAIDNVKQVAAQARQVVMPRPDDTLAALTALATAR